MYIIKTTVYFSVENNGVGEGIIALYQADDNPTISAEFVSENGKNRLGMTTTGKSKLRACVNLKELIENNSFDIRSNVVLAELKAFTRRSGTYSAQLGSTDDTISALLIITRLLEEISTYEQAAYDKLYAGANKEDEWDDMDIEYDDTDEPLPMTFG